MPSTTQWAQLVQYQREIHSSKILFSQLATGRQDILALQSHRRPHSHLWSLQNKRLSLKQHQDAHGECSEEEHKVTQDEQRHTARILCLQRRLLQLVTLFQNVQILDSEDTVAPSRDSNFTICCSYTAQGHTLAQVEDRGRTTVQTREAVGEI